MLFSEVTGHEKVKELLKVALNNERIGHAYIFEGPDGVGKLYMAKAFAMGILCQQPDKERPCGNCKSCSMFLGGNHPDIKIVTNQLYDSSKKSVDVLVDTIRNMKREIYIKPYLSERKVYIVPRADTMNVYAQNSLLKILEEPPLYCTIILLAENSNSFLPTILSRAQMVKFFLLSKEEVFRHITRKCPDIEPLKLKLASELCMGSISRAAMLLEDEELNKIRDDVIDLTVSLSKESRKNIYELTAFLKTEKNQTELIFNILQGFCRDLMYVKATNSYDGVTNTDKKEQLEKFADRVSEKAPQKMLEILFKYKEYLSKNISHAQVMQCMSLELWEAINDRSYRNKI